VTNTRAIGVDREVLCENAPRPRGDDLAGGGRHRPPSVTMERLGLAGERAGRLQSLAVLA